MLSVRDLSVAIARANILHDVELTIPTGKTAGLIGRNGAGKTTFMRTVMGFVAPQGGQIIFDDIDLAATAPHKRTRLGIGYMPEDRRLIPQLSVEENILLPIWATGRGASGGRLQRIYRLIPEVAGFAERKAFQLSGGQQKLAALARALISGTKLLLLDEPFEGVAPALAQRLAEVIGTLRAEGLSVLLSESDYTHSVDILDLLFVIERGVVEAKDIEALRRPRSARRTGERRD